MVNSKIHIGKIILEKLKEDERSIAWLSRQIHLDSAHLGRLLHTNPYIHTNLLWRISVAMNTDFFAYFSEQIETISNHKSC
jgi:plasmid maintenance system antidote protein VapI